MSDRVAEMKAEIEAKQRELERIEAEEAKKRFDTLEFARIETGAKKNIFPPLIEVLEESIGHEVDFQCLHHKWLTAYRNASNWRGQWFTAEQAKAEEVMAEVVWTSRKSNLLRDKAHLVTARADAEWKIQSFKIIDALTQRVAALEARLDAKETVPIGTPVLGSYLDSGEDSVEDSCEGSSSHESIRRTLFPYW